MSHSSSEARQPPPTWLVFALLGAIVLAVLVWLANTVWTALSEQDADDDSVEVSATEFGADWPLRPTSGVLRYSVEGTRQAVYFQPDGRGREYGVNGQGRADPLAEDVLTIARPGVLPYQLQPLIDRGLQLCASADAAREG
jgi:hypothetical protein